MGYNSEASEEGKTNLVPRWLEEFTIEFNYLTNYSVLLGII
jgi:hypothetical protein